ncbi:MAG: mycothiol synthase [Geodermatophilaceae bacterium]|nr:mycothiol synthase [Geodermatophilaceae bacterium]
MTVSEQGRLTEAEAAEVAQLLDAVADADGVSPVNEHVLLHLRHGGDIASSNFLLRAPDGALAGYAHLDPTDPIEGPAAELTIHPDRRGHGLGRRLLSAVEQASPDGRLRLWAHGAHAGAEALALQADYSRARVLWQMRKSLLARLPPLEVPEGVRFRQFEQGQDEAAWTALNNAAFADHPDQGGWSEDDILLREKEPWFDPSGFLLAERIPTGAAQGEPELIGFHWTKIHGSTTDLSAHKQSGPHAHEPIGEVYVLGVHPSARGIHLGPALTVAGLRYLRSRGLRQVMLYVDESNTAAISIYKRLGFTRWDTDISYTRDDR